MQIFLQWKRVLGMILKINISVANNDVASCDLTIAAVVAKKCCSGVSDRVMYRLAGVLSSETCDTWIGQEM
ncbi:hypothetical protein Tco_1223560, partial [Tanacetum coccineum]